MGVIELFMVAVGLSMDAFAISICKGLTLRKMEWDKSLITGIYFGFFQAMMPLIGYVLGIQFSQSITNFDHWIAFILLSYIGINMIKESKEDETQNQSFGFKTMIPLAIASSIDALAVGITFAFLNVNIITAVIFIGITTFIFSFFGVKIGNVFGSKYKSKAELCGGIILILMGVKILIEHLFF